MKTNIFATTLLLRNLPSATHPPLPSAKTFFIAMRQCYFEMKSIKQPYFSILSSLILCVCGSNCEESCVDQTGKRAVWFKQVNKNCLDQIGSSALYGIYI